MAHKPQKPITDLANQNYLKLASVLLRAHAQASEGKGKERHANDDAFESQPICAIGRLLGSVDGNLFQASKKLHEARRLPTGHAVSELLGAINYLAAAVILIEEGILENKE